RSTFSSISELKPNKDNWKIKTKIIRLWKQYFPVVGETIQLVICDAFGHTIHATVNDVLVARSYPILKEGNSLMILNFNVRPSVGSYQTTKHPHKIVFSSKTRVRVSELLPRQLTGFHLVVVRFSSLDIISVNGKDTHNDQRVTIILWGDNAVVERSVSNVCNISDIAFNPDMDKVESFWKLLPEVDIILEHMELKPLCLVSDIADKIDFFVDTSRKTITQVLDTTQVQMCIITCTIAEIGTDKGWYDMSCKVCGKEVLNVSNDWCVGHADNLNIQNHYYCVNCVNYSPKHDIRLIQGRPLPAVLTKLVGKTYFFKIKIDVPNYLYKHEPFKILNIITSTDMIYELQVNHSPMDNESTNYRGIPRCGSLYLLEDANSLEMNCVTKGSCSVRVKKKKTHISE
ncbi:hypothetical protein N665_2454s0001, partial [Sinapis alba]